MATFTLDILLEDDDIEFLNELGYSICIVRPVLGFDLGAVWHRIPPKLMSHPNTVEWSEELFVFHKEWITEAGETLHYNHIPHWGRHGCSRRHSRSSVCR